MRARNIKPSLFKNEVLGTADPLFTILFEGLWCEADRDGRLEDRPMRIRAEVFPYRQNIDIDAQLAWLHDNGFIRRYEVKGLKVIQIIKFSEHQRPHSNEVASALPPEEKALATKVSRTSNQGRKRFALIPDSPSLIPDTTKALPAPVAGLDGEAWKRWEDYRKALGKPIKAASLDAAQREMAAMGSNQARAVQRSIAAGWQGLFPPKDAPPPIDTKARDERLERLAAEGAKHGLIRDPTESAAVFETRIKQAAITPKQTVPPPADFLEKFDRLKRGMTA